MNRRSQIAGWLATVVLVITAAPITAQWPQQPARGLPRKADGTVDLTAPAPRLVDGTPDLSGLWQMTPGSYVVNAAQDLAPGDTASSRCHCVQAKSAAVLKAPFIVRPQ